MGVKSRAVPFLGILTIGFGLSGCNGINAKHPWQSKIGNAATMGKLNKISANCREHKQFKNRAKRIISSLLAQNKRAQKMINKHYLKRATRSLSADSRCRAMARLKRLKT